MLRTRTATVLAAAAMLAAGTAGCSLQHIPAADTTGATSTALNPAEVRAALASIPVRAEWPMDGYDRDLFDVWASQGDGCDTRAVFLQRASTGPVETNEHCTVQTGTWVGAYTGRTFTDASDVDVDHLVPLAEAWRSGADDWPTDLRIRFGNDLEHGNIVAADDSTNSAKSDEDPAGWLPPRDTCGYVADYVQVTAHWHEQAQRAGGYELALDPTEKQAIERELSNCR